MLRFFSKIRLKLAADNKPVKYMRYAIGEIVLVVIGILIALQINNWNAYEKDRILEKQYLLKFQEEMALDSSWLTGYWLSAYPQKIAGLLLARQYVKESIEIKDTAEFLNSIGKGGISSRAAIFETTNTYEDIISTGNLKLITNPALQSQIVSYYTTTNNTRTYLDHLRTEYATCVNSYLPFDSSGNFKPDKPDFARAMEKFKTDDFLNLTNQELTFAFAMNGRMERHADFLLNLMETIKTELKKFE